MLNLNSQGAEIFGLAPTFRWQTLKRIDGAIGAATAVGRILAGDTGPGIYETTDRPHGFLVAGGDDGDDDTEEWDDLLLV